MKPEWRRILEHRSALDKIGIAIDCDLADPATLPVIADLVCEGIIVWIDRTVLTQLVVADRQTRKPSMTQSGYMRRPNVDVYQLTEKGIALCDAEGIRRK
jgi:hypothetical protein